jgi:hypothetical protein
MEIGRSYVKHFLGFMPRAGSPSMMTSVYRFPQGRTIVILVFA